MGLRESLNDPVSSYASSTFAKVAESDSVAKAAKTMQGAGVTEALVVAGGRPIGIVTERDILYKVVAAGSDPSSATVGEVMSSPVESVDEGSKVGEALEKMTKLGVRRLAVTRKGALVGIITQKAVVSGDLDRGLPLPELASPHKIACPYCDEEMNSREELSKHIDRVHLGLGLLEGDRTKW
jgi:CBS domain-containing protein